MTIKYPDLPHPKNTISVREFSRNLSYFVDHAQHEPIYITKRGNVLAVLTIPKTILKKTPKKLEDLAFFKNFVEPKVWKNKTSLQIATKLREKAWYGR